MTTSFPSYFVSHGGGPWPWAPELRAHFAPLEAALAAIPRQLHARPRAVLLISGHWEANEYRVMAAAQPAMVYDFSGFPPHTYEIQYPAPGDPQLAAQVRDLIAAAGLPTVLDSVQGFDHGAYAPLFVMYPQADVPLLQLSLRHGYDPAEHLALGRALAPLREQGVLIVGSGLSYHNLRRFGPAGREAATQFDAWLQQTLVDSTPAERSARLIAWEQAPAARQAHPRADHLLPLMVAVGAAEGEGATCNYHQRELFGGVVASGWRFGG